MSSVVIAGNTSGSVTLSAPDVAGTTTLTLPATSGTVLTTASSGQSIPKAALPTGSVLQVVQTTKLDSFSTTSTSYVDITGFSVSITPTSSTSKILVMCNMEIGGANGADANHVYLQLYRNSTAIFAGSAAGSRTAATAVVNTPLAGTMYPSNCCYLDSPATTSAVTYKMQIKSSNSGTACMNRSGRDNDAATYDGRAVSSITVMEIAA